MPNVKEDENNEIETEDKPQPDIAQIVNSAVTSQLKRALPKVVAELKTSLAEQLKPAEPEADASDETDSKAKASGNDAVEKQIEKLQRKLREVEKRERDKEQALATERARTQLRSALSGKVREDMTDIAVSHLMNVENRVSFDNEGNAVFKHDDIEWSIGEGIAEYLKTDQAKPFLPAPKTPNKQSLPQDLRTARNAPQSEADRLSGALGAMADAGIDPNSLFE